jgi:hypothetical protein
MPYSPRWFEGALWFCNAGRGQLLRFDFSSKTLDVICELPTFVRGLDFVGPYAVVAGSASRFGDLLDGLPLGERLAASGSRPEQGLWVIDTSSGEVVHRLSIDGTAREVFSVVAFHGRRRVGLISPNDDELQVVVSYDRGWTGTT